MTQFLLFWGFIAFYESVLVFKKPIKSQQRAVQSRDLTLNFLNEKLKLRMTESENYE